MHIARFVIRGARGTMPICGKSAIKYGANTTCFSLQTDEGLIIIDAGTGISNLADDLAHLPSIPPITMLFTHFHIDHLIGLPSFYPLYSSQAKITIMGDPRRKDNWRKTLHTFMGKPFWPIGLGDADAAMTLEDLPIAKNSLTLYGVNVSWFSAPHPQTCLAYRFATPTDEIVVATDVEYETGNVDPAFVDFCKQADVLIYDAQYTPDEYPAHRGWGHSSWETAAHLAGKAEVSKLILTHHAPDRKDAQIDAIKDAAKAVFPNTDAARGNLIVTGH